MRSWFKEGFVALLEIRACTEFVQQEIFSLAFVTYLHQLPCCTKAFLLSSLEMELSKTLCMLMLMYLPCHRSIKYTYNGLIAVIIMKKHKFSSIYTSKKLENLENLGNLENEDLLSFSFDNLIISTPLSLRLTLVGSTLVSSIRY